MIDWLEEAYCREEANGREELPNFSYNGHIFQVLDGDGKLRCLFKAYCDKDEELAKNEACVYLLDHLVTGHRSFSQEGYGFSGVLPLIFVKFKKGNQQKMRIMVEYIETVGEIGSYNRYEIAIDDMHKVAIADLRFDNIDRSPENLLVRKDENGSLKLMPIDNEPSFSNTAQPYNICSPYWMTWLKWCDKEGFSSGCVDYVRSLDAVKDLKFLQRCGFEIQPDYNEQFHTFTVFEDRCLRETENLFNQDYCIF